MPGERNVGANQLGAGGAVRIYNLTLTDANTEYPQQLPTDTRKFAVRPRTSTHVLKLAFIANQSATNYVTVDSAGYYEDGIGVTTFMLYLQSTTAGAVVEIVAWN